VPVLLAETLHWLLRPRGAGLYLDATFGGGGHSRAILEADPDNRVLALDLDPEAVARGRAMAAAFAGRLRILHLNFARIAELEETDFAGILFDFGLSSYHYDTPARGFSFRLDGPLDMRIDPGAGIDAATFLATANRAELTRAVRDYGEEPRWRAVVAAIERARGSAALGGTVAFAQLVAEAVGPSRGPQRLHPATRVFQGIRIAVNGELEAIASALPAAFDRLAAGGRMVAISFHSLEDRIVKRCFRELAGRPVSARDSRPQQSRVVRATLPFNRPITPPTVEYARNPRARSARLRALHKLENPA
jgi:16S rRNA (cytosine1402-N4)-methyltransferase